MLLFFSLFSLFNLLKTESVAHFFKYFCFSFATYFVIVMSTMWWISCKYFVYAILFFFLKKKTHCYLVIEMTFANILFFFIVAPFFKSWKHFYFRPLRFCDVRHAFVAATLTFKFSMKNARSQLKIPNFFLGLWHFKNFTLILSVSLRTTRSHNLNIETFK